MMSRCLTLLGVAQLALCSGCAPLEDPVFDLVSLHLSSGPLRFAENAGVVTIPVNLTRPASEGVSVSYHAVEVTAQSGCQVPDFEAASGTLVWPAGALTATLQIWIEDDTVAETDEHLKLVFSDATGVALDGAPELDIEIDDDDRTALIDARASFGVEPNSPVDQTAALQSALDAAAASGRGVVVLAPGTYPITSVSVSPGTTLSGRMAFLRRPAHSAPDVKTLVVSYSGMVDSAPTLIEGLAIDGQRNQQGAYLGYERELANLINATADPTLPGRLQLSLESLSLSDGTGDGIGIGTNLDARFCHLHGEELWRDMFSVRGGNTRLSVRDLDSSATVGKSGIYFDGAAKGFGGTRSLDLQLEDLRLDTGDVEIEVSDGSRVSIQRLVMTQAPFRLAAPGSTVIISDSVITSGVRTTSQNYWGLFQDIQVKNSTLRISESDDTGTGAVPTVLPEADRQLTPVQIEWPAPAVGTVLTGTLTFENCQFDQASDVEATDTVYAVNSRSQGPTVRVISSTLAPSFAGFFAPGCSDCRVQP